MEQQHVERQIRAIQEAEERERISRYVTASLYLLLLAFSLTHTLTPSLTHAIKVTPITRQ